jgi:cytochrome c556
VAAAAGPAEALKPVASVRQIMRGVVDPAATIVFNAVSTTVTASGTEEKAPATPEEWEKVANSAAALAEAGNLLLIGSRAVDRDEWSTWSRLLSESGAVALKAAEARDAAGVFASGEAIYEACNSCHAKYERTQ